MNRYSAAPESLRAEIPLGKSKKHLTTTELHINEQRSARGNICNRRRIRTEGHNLPIFRKMRHGASFGHVYQIASHCQAGGDDVIELPEHGDLTVERNVQHSVKVAVSYEETVTIRFHRIQTPVNTSIGKPVGGRAML